ncbi:MAG: hypothetical protein AMJ65_16580 [Phycisphaerae bacterium SG8_4]|nr:MAG: hypothetical protein AMJ65_16580 [Phycisphaerae bacterium SG8_4]
MKRQKRYWNGVMIMTCILCLVMALAYWIVPSVRAGTVPPIGGIVWHALAPFQLLIANVFRPFAYGIAPAKSPSLGLVILLLMTLGSSLLISMVMCLPLRFGQPRLWVKDNI